MVSVIQATEEFQRISRIPRRDWASDATAFRDVLHDELKKPFGRQELKPIQAAALAEMTLYGGLFAPIKVGGGKTHISLLAPIVMESKRPMLLVPAKLIEKTKRAMSDLSWHWRVAKHLRIVSYETLGRVGSAHALEEYQPDLIIADEAHKLKNLKAAVTKRVNRYLKASHDVPFVGMAGTFIRRSIREYSHILWWASRRSNYFPLPHTYHEITDWADALDERNVADRPSPGALLTWPGADDLDPLTSARHAYRQRLIETPGVIVSANDDRPEASLEIDDEIFNPEMPRVDELISQIRETYETPDGYALTEATQVWQHVRQLALGFYYRYVVRPADDWFAARKAWAAFVREEIALGKLDSEQQVALHYPHCRELEAWQEQRDSFTPETEAVWIDDALVKRAADWLRHHRDGIAWVDYREFGRRLSEVSGRPFFHADARDDSGRYVLDATGSIVASQFTVSEGLDLQHKWSSNLILSPSRNSARLEQILGRTHRIGQIADVVTATIVVCCVEHYDAIRDVIEEAKHVRDTTGDEHKILYCDLSLTEFKGSGGRWQRTT